MEDKIKSLEDKLKMINDCINAPTQDPILSIDWIRRTILKQTNVDRMYKIKKIFE